MTDDKMLHESGASTSTCPDLSQIPYSALEMLAERFKLGEAKHGRHNWRRGLGKTSYALERVNHIIRHAYHLAAQLEFGIDLSEDTIEENIGAILWGGAFLAEYAYDAKQTYLTNEEGKEDARKMEN